MPYIFLCSCALYFEFSEPCLYLFICIVFSRMSQSYFYFLFLLRYSSYHVTFGYQAIDTKIPESRMVQPAASLVDLLKGNSQISPLSREFVTALLIVLCQKIEARIHIICGQQILIFNSYNKFSSMGKE